MNNTKKTCLLCRSTGETPFALMARNMVLKEIKADPDILVRQCSDLITGIIELYITIVNSSDKIFSSISKLSRLRIPDSLQVINHIGRSPNAMIHQFRNLKFTTFSSMLLICKWKARFEVRVYNYIIYADREIPIETIRDFVSFMNQIEDPSFRAEYGIVCITKNFGHEYFGDSEGIIYFDASHFIEVINYHRSQV